MKTVISSFIWLSLLLFLPAQANDFKYETVYSCGPKQLGESENYKSLGAHRWQYFFVNIAADGRFVVLHDDIQYTNFRDTVITPIYHQAGGTFRATVEVVGKVLVFKLFDKESDYLHTLSVDSDTGEYLSQVSRGTRKFQPARGICWSNS